MKIKEKIVMLPLVLLTLTCCSACRALYPEPVKDPNAQGFAEPISYYGDVQLFAEVKELLRVKVTAYGQVDSLQTFVREKITGTDVAAINSAEEPFDIHLKVHSEFKPLATDRKTYLDHLLKFEVLSSNGTAFFAPQTHKTHFNNTGTAGAVDHAKFMPAVRKDVETWINNTFLKDVPAGIGANILRFRLTRKLIELNPVIFQQEQRELLNKIRMIDGVIDVRMIEVDNRTRVISMRVLFDRKKIPYGLADKIRNK